MIVSSLSPEHFPLGLLTLAVYGPGTGEAQVLRFPDGTFGVVDGCRAHKGVVDPVHRLLQRFTDPVVRFVCLTHAHGDHFGGLLDLIDAYVPKLLLWAGSEGDRFRDRFVASVRREQRGLPHPVDPDELQALIDVLAFRTQRKRGDVPRSRSVVLSDHKLVLRGADGVRVWGVLPTTTSLHRALGCGLHPLEEEDVEPRSRAGDPNDVSGALLVEWGKARVLLGGDALRGDGAHHEGWAAADWIDQDVQVVKVAHHASSGAHHAPLWARMKPRISIVTPYADASGCQPPRESQLRELLRTSRVFLTAPPSWWDGRLYLDGFDTGARVRPMGTPLTAVTGAGARTPRVGSRDPESAVAVTLDAEGEVRELCCSGQARELRLRVEG